MVKLVGAVLLCAGGTALGLRAAGQMRRRAALLGHLTWALDMMERELALRRTALPELLKELEKLLPPEEKLFADCLSQLEQGQDFTYAWEQALESVQLKEEDRILLRPLGRVLGRYDAQGQQESLARTRQELQRRLEEARMERDRLRHVYGMLGAAGGVFLTLLLL